MPNPAKPNLSIAFDMYGCPHACRHCWLGSPVWKPMDEEVVFASFAAARQLADVKVQYIAPDWREPHMAPHCGRSALRGLGSGARNPVVSIEVVWYRCCERFFLRLDPR